MTLVLLILAVGGAFLVAGGLVDVLMADNVPLWMSRPTPWADAEAVRRFPPERYRRQGIATILMGAAFLVEAATSAHYPASALAVPLFAASVAMNLSATRLGGLGYRSKRTPWIIAAIALVAVVILTAVFVVLMTGDSHTACPAPHPANEIPACITGH